MAGTRRSLTLLLGLFWCAAVALLAHGLPLDDYVNLPDSSYKWELANTVKEDGYVLYVIKLTSQTWSFVQTDKPVWQHWLKLVVPDNIDASKSTLIYINGGGNPLGNPPSSIEGFLPPVAMDLGAIVAELGQIPNQPLVFEGEDFGRSEDSLLAKSWDMFIQTRDPMVIARFPMVKSVVRAMDAIQEFTATTGSIPTPKSFLLAGGSKRGWVTWLAGSVDGRVIGVAPLVIDVLDMQPNFNDIYQTYGKWPVALKDYVNQNITRCLNCPVFKELAAVEDPLVYLERYKARNIPIFAVNACGDEFFIPTGWKWWYDQYTGEKFIRYMPNAEHSLATALERVVSTLTVFSHMLDTGIQRPKIEWSFSADKSQISLTTDQTPKSVKLWQAYNRRSRRFIANCYLTCLWRSEELPSLGNGTYAAKVEVPSEGYRAFMLELEYDIGWIENLVIGTGVSIVPDKYDELPCPDSECALCDTC